MPTAHLTLAGDWVTCTDAGCGLKFHLPDLTVAEAERMPLSMLLPLLEVIDPPSNRERGIKQWRQLRAANRSMVLELHRDYDLPAVVYPDGTMSWYRHGKRHREGKPALLRANGSSEYWVNGELVGTP